MNAPIFSILCFLTASVLGLAQREVSPNAISIVGMLCCFAAASSPTMGYLASIAAVLTAYVRVQGRVAGAPQNFCGPMAKPHRMFVVTVAAAYCALAPFAWQPVWRGWGVPALALCVIAAGALLTSLRRLSRIVRYLKGEVSC